LEFTSLTLPGENIPLHAKVIAAGHNRVDAEGKVQGRGHPIRDAIEWTIPLLWPIKVLTLPARGPQPAFKKETRIELRLTEDMWLPDNANSASDGLASRTSPSPPETHQSVGNPPAPPRTVVLVYPPRSPVAAPRPRADLVIPQYASPLYLIAFFDHTIRAALSYSIEGNLVHYVTQDLQDEVASISAIDRPLTMLLNRQRRVPFYLPPR